MKGAQHSYLNAAFELSFCWPGAFLYWRAKTSKMLFFGFARG